MNKIRVRFPPSPTGNLHIGNARTALFNFLFARHHQGTFVFRIEDTDPLRSKEAYIANEIEAMEWLGLDWDEGIEKGGNFGPYRQSQRFSLYLEVAQKLIQEEKAYPCFCTSEEIAFEKQQAEISGIGYSYKGKCRNISSSEAQKRISLNVPHTVRFKIPCIESVQVHDMIRGSMTFPLKGIDDFIMIRSDQTPTYNFAVMVDDALMNISHVIRGEDHLFGNTPRQVLLYHALSYPVPTFGHMPMILGTDKTKLSKRHGAFAVTDYRCMGFLPEAITNYMALLGWSPGNDIELMSMHEMITSFNIEKVQSSPAVFDFEKLQWFNSQYLRNKPSKALIHIISQEIENAGNVFSNYTQDELEQMMDALKSYCTILTDIPQLISTFENYNGISEKNIPHLDKLETPLLFDALINAIKQIPSWSTDHIRQLIKDTGKAIGVKGRLLFHPIRLALTDQDEGPDLNLIIYVLGKEKTIKLIQKALKCLDEHVHAKEGNDAG